MVLAQKLMEIEAQMELLFDIQRKNCNNSWLGIHFQVRKEDGEIIQRKKNTWDLHILIGRIFNAKEIKLFSEHNGVVGSYYILNLIIQIF